MKGVDRMAGQRQDAWSEEEDLFLAETVLKHIRQGSTQLAAFKDVGVKLSRTPAACGFRWNSLIRKRYEKAITLAKQERRLRHTSETKKDNNEQENMTINDVIQFLKTLSGSDQTIAQLKAQNENLQKQLDQLKKEYEKQLTELQQENEMLKKDYTTMFEIIERASKVVSFQKDEKKENI